MLCRTSVVEPADRFFDPHPSFMDVPTRIPEPPEGLDHGNRALAIRSGECQFQSDS
jgi:hypothetical protein